MTLHMHSNVKTDQHVSFWYEVLCHCRLLYNCINNIVIKLLQQECLPSAQRCWLIQCQSQKALKWCVENSFYMWVLENPKCHMCSGGSSSISRYMNVFNGQEGLQGVRQTIYLINRVSYCVFTWLKLASNWPAVEPHWGQLWTSYVFFI